MNEHRERITIALEQLRNHWRWTPGHEARDAHRAARLELVYGILSDHGVPLDTATRTAWAHAADDDIDTLATLLASVVAAANVQVTS